MLILTVFLTCSTLNSDHEHNRRQLAQHNNHNTMHCTTKRQIYIDRVMSDILLLPSNQFAGLIDILKQDNPALQEKLCLCETKESVEIDLAELNPPTLLKIQSYASRSFKQLRRKTKEQDQQHNESSRIQVVSSRLDHTIKDGEDCPHEKKNLQTVQPGVRLYHLKYGDDSDEESEEDEGD